MEKYKVKLNSRAYRDLEDIYEYILRELQAPEAAKRQTDRIKQAIKSLDVFPQAHQERNIGRYAGRGYRQLLIDNYIAVFKIDEPTQTVSILTIQYKGRSL